MASDKFDVKPTSTTAPLSNVTLFLELVQRLVDRPRHLPGIGVFYGPSGYGKTFSAIYGANKYGAYYVECGASWTASTLVDSIHHELTGHAIRGTVALKIKEIVRLLADETRPVIIDEADYLVKKTMVDVMREISDQSSAPVILIGEEQLPHKLLPFERAHNRVLDWMMAQPADLNDCAQLAKLYAPQIEIATDLLQHIEQITEGCTRRVVINFERVRTFALERGLETVTLNDWGSEQTVYSGMPAPRRRARARKVA